MSAADLKRLLFLILTKELLLSLEDGLKAEALKAHGVVRDHSGLKDRRRARSAEGQLRFRMMEERFEEICQLHGGHLLEGGVIPHSDLKIFQPFCRFEVEGRGVILGLAAMPEQRVLPSKNKSRVAGVSVNCHLLPGLFDVGGPKDGDIFALLLVSRHRERAGLIEEVAVGVVDSKYESFLFYERLDKFLSGEDAAPADLDAPPPPSAPPVTLKKAITPFVPPEMPPAEKKETGTE